MLVVRLYYIFKPQRVREFLLIPLYPCTLNKLFLRVHNVMAFLTQGKPRTMRDARLLQDQNDV